MAFTRFADLPTETRLMIWSEILFAETAKRFVIIHKEHSSLGVQVIPLKHLISPLLSVNRESRCEAQRFYHLRLTVHTAQAVGSARNPHVEASQCYTTAPLTTPEIGTLYLKPERDLFVRKIPHKLLHLAAFSLEAQKKHLSGGDKYLLADTRNLERQLKLLQNDLVFISGFINLERRGLVRRLATVIGEVPDSFESPSSRDYWTVTEPWWYQESKLHPQTHQRWPDFYSNVEEFFTLHTYAQPELLTDLCDKPEEIPVNYEVRRWALCSAPKHPETRRWLMGKSLSDGAPRMESTDEVEDFDVGVPVVLR